MEQDGAGGLVVAGGSEAAAVLLVVDMQNDFLEGGALEVPHANSILENVNALATRFEHVIFTQDWHPADHSSFASQHPGKQPFDSIEMPYGPQTLWPDHCVRGTKGAEIHPDISMERCQLVLRKGYRKRLDSYSAFYENDRVTPTGLSGYLRERGIEDVVACGLATDFCVLFTLLDAVREGFNAILVSDASCPISTNQEASQRLLQKISKAHIGMMFTGSVVKGRPDGGGPA